jgi:hypothetical protein
MSEASELTAIRGGYVPTTALTKAACQTILRAAPALQELHVGIQCGPSDLDALLAGTGELAPLRLRRLDLNVRVGELVAPGAFARLMAQVAQCEPLRELVMNYAPLGVDGALDALVDAACARQLEVLEFELCSSWPENAAARSGALVRLLDGCAASLLSLRLDTLAIAEQFFERAGAVLFADALRRSRLRDLHLTFIGIWGELGVGVPVLRALTGHPTLAGLELLDSEFGIYVNTRRAPAIGVALGALVRANSATLTYFYTEYAGLSTDDRVSLCEALPHNTHLQHLNLSYNVRADFTYEHVLPNLRRNSSLRHLRIAVTYGTQDGDAAREAMEWVRRAAAERDAAAHAL